MPHTMFNDGGPPTSYKMDSLCQPRQPREHSEMLENMTNGNFNRDVPNEHGKEIGVLFSDFEVLCLGATLESTKVNCTSDFPTAEVPNARHDANKEVGKVGHHFRRATSKPPSPAVSTDITSESDTDASSSSSPSPPSKSANGKPRKGKKKKKRTREIMERRYVGSVRREKSTIAKNEWKPRVCSLLNEARLEEAGKREKVELEHGAPSLRVVLGHRLYWKRKMAYEAYKDCSNLQGGVKLPEEY
ncbi:hypothetical protein EDC01DRAFT_788408 [Geopyxis carbonaria]|nr:hypothetical protein EDC01DRAFT_788408 [Geopyxis carbonaria]